MSVLIIRLVASRQLSLAFSGVGLFEAVTFLSIPKSVALNSHPVAALVERDRLLQHAGRVENPNLALAI